MKTAATVLLAVILFAGPASGIDGIAGHEAVMRHSAYMHERPTPDECVPRVSPWSCSSRHLFRVAAARAHDPTLVAA